MSANLMQEIQSKLSPAVISQIASAVGASPEQAQSAVGLALPTLIAALAGNASTTDGAASLSSALKSHAGADTSGFASIAGMLGQAASSGAGQSILKHVLGGQQSAAQEKVGEATGLGAAQIGQIFAMLAPLVMAQLGQKQKEDGLDIGSLARMLQTEGAQAQQSGGGLGGLLGGLLGGGAGGAGGGLKAELAQQGLKALGGFLSRNKG